MRKARRLVQFTNYPVRGSGDKFLTTTPADQGVNSALGEDFCVTFVGFQAYEAAVERCSFPLSSPRVLVLDAGAKRGYLRELIDCGRFSRVIWKEITTADVVAIKLFQAIGIIAGLIAILRGKKLFCLLVGDPERSALARHDLIRNDFVRCCVATAIKWATRFLIKRAEFPVFVSLDLAKRYGGRENDVIASESWLTDVDYVNGEPPLADYARRLRDGRKRALRVIFVGRIVREKGVFELYAGMRAARRRIQDRDATIDLSLRYVGTGKDVDELTRFIAEEDKPWVGFAGYKTALSDELRREYRGADVFVLPSFSEGLPLSLLEAASAKLLLVASDVGGIPEIVQDGENGKLIKVAETVETLEHLISDVAMHPERYVVLAERAHRLAQERSFAKEQARMYHAVQHSC